MSNKNPKKRTTRVDLAEDVRLPTVLQPQTVLANARALNDCFPATRTGDLRRDLLTNLVRLNQHPFQFDVAARLPALQFGPEQGLEEETLKKLMCTDTLPSEWRYSPEEEVAIRAKTQGAMNLLERTDQATFEAFQTLVGALYFSRQSRFGGGSLSAIVGAVCLSPMEAWSLEEYAGHILHEFIHQILFLDDMVNRLFTVNGEVLGGKECRVTSAILKTKRPYDRAFHSAFVLATMLHFSARIGRPGILAASSDDLRVTIAQLLEKGHLLTSHGRRHVEELSMFVERMFPGGASC